MIMIQFYNGFAGLLTNKNGAKINEEAFRISLFWYLGLSLLITVLEELIDRMYRKHHND
jgi:hypothetical protein